MDDILDDLIRAAQRCDRAARVFEAGRVHDSCDQLIHAAQDVGPSWSGSWLGYHASVYLENFIRPHHGIIFDCEWGLTSRAGFTSGPWRVHDYEEVKAEIMRRANVDSYDPICDAAENVSKVFDEVKEDVLPTIDAFLDAHEDKTVRAQRDEIAKLQSQTSQQDFIRATMPKHFMSRDSLAYHEGIKTPHHLSFLTWIASLRSCGAQAAELGKKTRYVVRYLERKHKMKGKTVAKTEGKIFLGHGRSPAWRELQAFIRDRLQLDYEEFNRESTAGISNKERLLGMLDSSCFAFLIMTAEDEQADGSLHARQNVIHEAGLFQGRYGFERAIVVLEEDCTPFSNIDGIGQIRYPKGNLKAAFEEIRHVLEREHIIK